MYNFSECRRLCEIIDAHSLIGDYSAKYNVKVHRLISAAKFRIADAALVNVYYEKRGLDRDLILTLGNCDFIEKNQPVVFNGFTGSGKSYLACTIGRQACMQG